MGIKMQKRTNTYSVFSFIQYSLMLALLFVVVIFSCHGFLVSTESRTENYDMRSSLSYITNKVKSFDAAGSVEVIDSRILVLRDITEKGIYETRIYIEDGKIMEEYSKAEKPISPEKGTVVGLAETFSVSLNNLLLTIKTDQGVGAVALKSQ